MPANTKLDAVSAEDVFQQIRRHLRRERVAPSLGGAVRIYSGAVVDSTAGSVQSVDGAGYSLEEVIQRLHRLYDMLGPAFDVDVRKIGGAPPIAGGLRGALGHVTIRILRRLLWWYTRSLRHFAESVGVRMQASVAALETMAIAQAEVRLEIAQLREEVRSLRESLEGMKDTRQ